MSSSPPDTSDTSKQQRKRLQGACDICRRKKIKCDSAMNPDNRCTHCISFGLECTHDQPVKKRGPRNSYVSLLESRVKSLENTLSKTDNSLSSVVGPRSLSSGSDHHSSPETVNDSSSSAKEEEEELSHVSLQDRMKKLSLHTMEGRFFGPSSGFALIQSVHGVRQEVTGGDTQDLQSFRRDQFWKIPPWELETARRERPTYVFPEHSLMVPLIALYFQKINPLFPILHAPTFKRNIIKGLHFENPHFGAVVLVVCALGARYSDDPRVLSSPDQSLSAGWKFFEQVPLLRRSLFDPPTLYELQFYALSAAFVIGTSSPGSGWYLIGLGIRSALDMGVHRKTPVTQKPTVESEQQKRAFWVLVVLDRLISGVFVGRPFALHEDDFDLELPIECDDEYWENPDPDLAFKQPSDKPSTITSFVALIKLCKILVVAVRQLFSIPKTQPRVEAVDQQAVVEVDSALNDWRSRLPEHLHWDPAGERGIFFEQSGFLHIYYYAVQIQTHRRFVYKSSPMSFTSLAICTNAAKSCSHIVDILVAADSSVREFILFSGFISGCLLLSNIWASKRAGVKIDLKKAMVDVEKLRNAFRICEKKFLTAGRFTDFLTGLSRGLEDNNPSAYKTPLIHAGQGGSQRPPDNNYYFEPSTMSPDSGGESSYPAATASNMTHDQTLVVDPLYQIFGEDPYGMQHYTQPAASSGGYYGPGVQSNYPGDNSAPTFDVEMWPVPQLTFEGWNNYATNMASLDLDMFIQSNPDVFQ